MTPKQTLLFLGASITQAPAIRRARALGYRTVAVDGDPNAVAFAHCHVGEAVDFSDVERVAEVGRRHRVDAVLAISTDRAVVPAARVARELGLPGPDVEVAIAMTNKAVMRATLAAGGVPQPAFAAVRTAGDLAAAASRIGLPAVLKPSDSGGQRGIYLVRSLDEASAQLPASLAFARNAVGMLEEYVEGSELNSLFVVRDGEPLLITLSDRLRPGGAGFGVGWIHSFPSSLPPETLQRAETVAADAIRALGLRDGIAFPQLIARADGSVVVIEVAARLAAGQMADLVRLGTGVNLHDVAFSLALGEDVDDDAVVPRTTRPIAIRFLTASPGVLPVGVVEHVDGLDEVRRSPGVLGADLYFAPGARLLPVQVDADRSGYVIATADTPTEALELADRASRELVVRTRSDDPPRPRSSRSTVASVALVCAVLAGVAVAFGLSEHAKLQRALVTGTRVSEEFSPVCHCAQDVARISFRLLRQGPLTVRIVNRLGRVVVTLRRDADLHHGRDLIVWRGTNASGRVVANGSYRPELDFLRLHRTLVLPSPIVVDVDRPRVLDASVHLLARGVHVAYRFAEPAHAVLLANGRRVVFTRSSRPDGSLTWVAPASSRGASSRSRFALVADDLAGNRSRPLRLR